MSAPKMAKEIVVRQVRAQGGHASFELLIDGEPFPWYIAEGSVEVARLGTSDTVPGVTLTILADRVETHHRYRGPADVRAEHQARHDANVHRIFGAS